MTFDIPFIRPAFPDSKLVAGDFERIVESNWYTNFGPREREFSAAISNYLGDGLFAVTFSSATTALIGAIQGLLGQGDGSRYVIVPSFTFAAGPAAIEWAGYKPLFIDIDEEALQPSLVEARQVLENGTRRISGILLCNTFGIGNVKISEWEALARQHGVPLVIDSAAGFGSQYADGSPVGTAGDCEVFSFHATKPFAIGEGGAVVTRNVELVQKLTSFQNFGFGNGGGASGRGLNGKLQEINAAIGLRQLAVFVDVLESRRSTLAHYRTGLKSVGAFPENIETSSVCFASIVVQSGAQRDALLSNLVDGGVEARAYYGPPVHDQPHFRAAERASKLAVTASVAKRIISLPVHHHMPMADVWRVIALASNE